MPQPHLWLEMLLVRRYRKLVAQIEALGPAMQAKSDAELQGMTQALRNRLAPSEWPEPTPFEVAGLHGGRMVVGESTRRHTSCPQPRTVRQHTGSHRCNRRALDMSVKIKSSFQVLSARMGP